MRNGWSLGRYRKRSDVLLAALGLAIASTQAACPNGAELEHPEAWAGRLSTSPPSSSAGGMNTSGTGGLGGNARASRALDKTKINCGSLDPEVVLATDCAKSGCHSDTALAAAGLRLTFAKIAGETKDVPAEHAGIGCPNDPLGECVPDTCPKDVLLVNSNAPASSWLSAKVHGMTTGCGDPMPAFNGYTAEQAANLACIDAIVQAIAAL